MAGNETVRDDIRRWGIRRAFAIQLFSRASPRLILSNVYLRDLTRPTEHRVDPALTYRVLSEDDLAKAREALPSEFPERFLKDARARGDLCIGAYDGSRLAAYVWRAYRVARINDFLIELPAGVRYGYKAYTRPEYRGRHIQTSLVVAMEHVCLQRGVRKSLSFIDVHNYSSIRSNDRREPRWAGRILFLRIGGQQRAWLSPAAKRLGIRLTSRAHFAAGEPEST